MPAPARADENADEGALLEADPADAGASFAPHLHLEPSARPVGRALVIRVPRTRTPSRWRRPPGRFGRACVPRTGTRRRPPSRVPCAGRRAGWSRRSWPRTRRQSNAMKIGGVASSSGGASLSRWNRGTSSASKWHTSPSKIRVGADNAAIEAANSWKRARGRCRGGSRAGRAGRPCT